MESLRIIVSKQEISKIVARLGSRVTSDYEGEDLVMIGVLKGGFIFMADLLRQVKMPVQIDFISVSSYGSSTKSSGVVKIIKDTDVDVSGKHLLIVEDIVDTGLTLKHLKELFYTRKPKSVKVCAMFDKPSRRVVKINVDYKGIEIEDNFVVGYGLDYDEMYRNLPDLCILEAD
jgi:hypoxanthine phosphoribosyltransferase